jgi:hypothetical protein
MKQCKNREDKTKGESLIRLSLFLCPKLSIYIKICMHAGTPASSSYWKTVHPREAPAAPVKTKGKPFKTPPYKRLSHVMYNTEFLLYIISKTLK